MSKWPMRGHFRYLRSKTFPMTPRTPQCEVFWALLSNSEHSGVPGDSKSSLFPSVGFFIVPYASLFFLLCCCLWFDAPLISLLFMLCCCLCFAFHCASLLLLLDYKVVLHCSSSYVSLLCNVSPLLCVSLLPCPLKYLSTFCCFVVSYCFVAPLPKLVIPPFLFCNVLEIWNYLGGSLQASKLTISFFFFFWFSFLDVFLDFFSHYFT
jgi:hypothetical protein